MGISMGLAQVLVVLATSWMGVSEARASVLPADKMVALQFRSGVSQQRIQEISLRLKEELHIATTSGAVFAKYRIIALGPSEESDVAERAIRFLNKLDPSLKPSEIPVLSENGDVKIPTGELIVKLNSGNSWAANESQFSKLHLVLAQTLESAPEGPFVLSDEDHNIARLIESGKELSKLPIIQYATPNYLEVMKRP
jgi:hypothetical protein